MVTHIVFWNLKDEALGNTKAENAARLQQKLTALLGQIEGLASLTVGLNFNPNGFDVALVSTFPDRAALDFYQDHPAHLEVKAFVKEITCDRAVCDYED